MEKENRKSCIGTFLNSPLTVALVTTLLGSVAIAILTNKVTEEMKIRDLQADIVKALMEHADEADLATESDIATLSALTALIQENEEFNVKVGGFQGIVDEYYERKKKEAQDKIDKIEDKLATAGQDSMEEQRLQEMLQESRIQKYEAERKLSKGRNTIDLLQQKNVALQQQLRDADRTISGLEDRIAELQKVHTLEFRIETVEKSDNVISVAFVDRRPVDFADFSNPTEAVRRSFSFIGLPYKQGNPSQSTLSLSVKVKDTSFLEAPIMVFNTGKNGWKGELSLLLDGKRIIDSQRISFRNDGELEGFDGGNGWREGFWISALRAAKGN